MQVTVTGKDARLALDQSGIMLIHAWRVDMVRQNQTKNLDAEVGTNGGRKLVMIVRLLFFAAGAMFLFAASCFADTAKPPNVEAVEPMTLNEAREWVKQQRPEKMPRKGKLPKDFWLTLNAPGCEPGEDCDDVGPLYNIRRAYMIETGQNMYHYGIGWGHTEPKAPVDGKHTYDFSSVKPDPFVFEHKYVVCHLGHFGSWADKLQFENEELYNQHLEKWAEAAARHANKTYGTTMFEVGGNERDLVAESTFKPAFNNWYEFYMSPVKAMYRGIKKANKNNKVIIGNFCYTDRAHIACIWLAGGGDSFDILAVHPYGPRGANVDLEQIIEAKEELTARGRGDVPIILTEGWSTLPLPPSLEGDKAWRGNIRPYTEPEVEHYRQAVLDGWRNLTTPKPGYYDPSWVKGASFFVLNDHWGGRLWEPRAKAEYDDNGNLKGFHLDGYFIGTSDPDWIKPLMRPWGIIDINGKPKGDTVFGFPPYIPKHAFEAKLDQKLKTSWFDPRYKTEWPVDEADASKVYRATVTFKNNEKSPMTSCVWSLGEKTDQDFPGGYAFAFVQGSLHRDGAEKAEKKVKAKLVSGKAPEVIKPGETVTLEYEVTFDPSLDERKIKEDSANRKRIRPIVDLYYVWEGRPYHTDAWLPRVVVNAEDE